MQGGRFRLSPGARADDDCRLALVTGAGGARANDPWVLCLPVIVQGLRAIGVRAGHLNSCATVKSCEKIAGFRLTHAGARGLKGLARTLNLERMGLLQQTPLVEGLDLTR